MKDCIIKLERLKKNYRMGLVDIQALRGIDLEINEGEFVSIMGPSGCGKSTLLNVLGCLDKPTEGKYYLNKYDISVLDDDTLSDMRCNYLGFVFQSYNLIPQLSVVENIEIPLYYQGVSPHESRKKATEIASRVGLGDRLYHKPTELSGGQQQRAGIARALVNDPLVILADEPTGNLDSKSGREIMNIFSELHSLGKTIIMVTHDEHIARYGERIVRLQDGLIETDESVQLRIREEIS
ncbi:MAG TPA: ABC transporter ATP-binding protein [Candidatus Hydrogenedens sp.]|nr:ABC transporter ATP-binding protein [Candidatus Hydrogenedens sp.]